MNTVLHLHTELCPPSNFHTEVCLHNHPATEHSLPPVMIVQTPPPSSSSTDAQLAILRDNPDCFALAHCYGNFNVMTGGPSARSARTWCASSAGVGATTAPSVRCRGVAGLLHGEHGRVGRHQARLRLALSQNETARAPPSIIRSWGRPWG